MLGSFDWVDDISTVVSMVICIDLKEEHSDMNKTINQIIVSSFDSDEVRLGLR